MNEQQTKDKKLARYEQALQDILDPIAAMLRDMPNGCTFNGAAALRLADNPQTYKDIAKKALELAK